MPPEVIALIEWQAEQIRILTARVAELEAKLGKNPNNSSKPPSSTHPHDKTPPAKPKSKRSRGGQPGHDKHERPLIATADCLVVVPCLRSECRRCGKTLTGSDPEPLRHQVWELPEIKPLVTEYQQHRLICSCGCSTCSELCWAHLKRDFQALIDSPCTVKKRLGHDLMRQTKKMFALWQRVRDGTLSRRAFRRRMKPIRQ